MGKILEYIQQSGNGKYQCYKTKKLSLDANDNDTIAYNYDDNTVVQTTKSVFADGKKIFPIVAGQIIIGCCEHKNRDTFKKYDLRSKIVLSMPDDFDDNDGGENFCRSYCEGLNEEINKIPMKNHLYLCNHKKRVPLQSK